MTGAFKVGKFDQSTSTIHEFDLPTPRTIIRFIYSDKNGSVWFPNNNSNKIGLIVQFPQLSTYPCDSKEFIELPNNYTLSIDGKEYSARYSGSINNITANIEKNAIEIDTATDCLLIELPRELIDSTHNGQVVPFSVLVDGQVSKASKEEMNSTGSRVLEISLPTTNFVKNVEIIGTSIAPEFGSIVMILISIAMTGIVVFTKVLNQRFGK